MKRVAFIHEEFALGTAGQQLLDRFLMGYARDGEFHRPEVECIAIPQGESGKALLEQRQREWKLSLEPSVANALSTADYIVLAWKGSGASANASLLEQVLNQSKPGTRCFIAGALANSNDEAIRAVALAANRGVYLSSSSASAEAFLLPPIDLPIANPRRALVAVAGPSPSAEFDACEGLFSLLEDAVSRARLSHVQHFRGAAAWHELRPRSWQRELLAAAISRSDTVQGDSLKDGRTEDIVGLGKIEGLAPEVRLWDVRLTSGFPFLICVLNGAVNDLNVAVQTDRRTIISTQLYRPPGTAQSHYDNLAARIEEYFVESAPTPLPPSALLTASLLGDFKKLSSETHTNRE